MRIITILMSVVLVAFLFGCSQSPIGIFESIELERAIVDDRALGNDLLVGSMTIAGDSYYIGAASLLRRSTTDTDYPSGDVAQWVALTAPGLNYTTSSVVTFSGSGSELVYAAYSSQSGTDSGVYSVDPATDPTAVVAGGKVLGVETAEVAGVSRLFVAADAGDTYLLAGVRETSTSRYSVYASTTAALDSFVEVDGTENNLPIIDIAASTTGNVAFLTEKALLVDSDGLNAGALPTDVASLMGIVDRQPEFGGLYYQSSSDTLWVTDNEGYIYRSVDFGATWASNATAHEISTSNESALEFTDLISLDNAGTEIVVVGTNGQGYRELDTSFVPVTPPAAESNYQASELAQATVLAFMVDPNRTVHVPTATGNDYELKTGDLLFAGTSSLGLWKTLYAGDSPQWVRE